MLSTEDSYGGTNTVKSHYTVIWDRNSRKMKLKISAGVFSKIAHEFKHNEKDKELSKWKKNIKNGVAYIYLTDFNTKIYLKHGSL